ncbi:hypothetical protein [Flavobacterium gawalongense]|uniref:hypothetical protein n=1 Tax=Flavobacterium gawalongense TaxID=2594432 RepID=UPI00163DBF02|nr:hypothetical protein [Flavobacterium gawalongense]
MNITENNLEELNHDQLTEITGGGFWYDFGAWSHRFINTMGVNIAAYSSMDYSG